MTQASRLDIKHSKYCIQKLKMGSERNVKTKTNAFKFYALS